jgi:hypothetical protein
MKEVCACANSSVVNTHAKAYGAPCAEYAYSAGGYRGSARAAQNRAGPGRARKKANGTACVVNGDFARSQATHTDENSMLRLEGELQWFRAIGWRDPMSCASLRLRRTRFHPQRLLFQGPARFTLGTAESLAAAGFEGNGGYRCKANFRSVTASKNAARGAPRGSPGWKNLRPAHA